MTMIILFIYPIVSIYKKSSYRHLYFKISINLTYHKYNKYDMLEY